MSYLRAKRYTGAVISVLLVAAILFGSFAGSLSLFKVRSFAVTTEKDETAYSYYLYDSYESSGNNFGFNANLANTSASYISPDSKVRSIDWNVLSDGHSLEVKSCDFRWWSLSVFAEEFLVGFEFSSVTDNYTNTLTYCINTQDKDTGTESLGGFLLKIVPENGKPVVKNRENKSVLTLENKTKYSFLIVMKRASETYDLFINGDLYGGNKMKSPCYCIKGQRVNAVAKDDESTFMLDNLSIFTPKKYSQAFSAQDKMDEPEVKFPDYEEQTKTWVFFNDTRVRSSHDVIAQNNTYYIPLEDFMKAIGGSCKEKDGTVTLTAPGFSAEAALDSATGTANGNTVSFNNAPIKSDRVIYAPLNMINVMFGLKVFYDAAGDMIVISNKEYATDDILRLVNCRFYMNGEPYYELSFNKFDIAYQISNDYYGYSSSYPNEKYTYAAAERAIKALAENGFTSIRLFCICGDDTALFDEDEKVKYYLIMDSIFDLFDKYGIRANVDLGLLNNHFIAKEYVEGIGWISKTETTADLVAFDNSESRQVLYNYLEEFIARYKDRKSVLMWEISNEGNLGADIGQGRAPGYSLLQLGKFYEDVTKKIKSIDPKHLVATGDACLRSSQYHLFLATIKGEGNDWSLDSYEQKMKALWLINYGVDVISSHTYGVGAGETGIKAADDTDANKVIYLDYSDGIEMARKLGKGFYAGEFSGTTPVTDMSIRKPEIAEYQKTYLDHVIDEGVQLGHWWTFESNRQGFGDDDTWNVSLDRHKFTFDVIAEANRKIKERYIVNGAAADNTVEATSTLTVSDNYSENEKKGCRSSLSPFAVFSVALIAVYCLPLFKKIRRSEVKK